MTTLSKTYVLRLTSITDPIDGRLRAICSRNGIHDESGGLVSLRTLIDRNLNGQRRKDGAARSLLLARQERREADYEGRAVNRPLIASRLREARLQREAFKNRRTA